MTTLDSEFTTTIRQGPVWQEHENLRRSVAGVEPVVSRTLLADLLELGAVSSRQIAALVGIAPFNQDSGTRHGRRMCWGADGPPVRTALYRATLVATKGNPVIAAFYQRLVAAGKLKKVAWVACMRKLLTILNAMVQHKTKWQEIRSYTS